jgi:diguanylate cyclase (GGDEF)-like protein
VLVVEPGENLAAAIEAKLRAAGASCRRVADAETAWRLFAQAPPDAVFTALTTPRRDAAWLLRRMQDEYLGSLPPVYGLVADDPGAAATARRLDLDGALLAAALPDELGSLLGAVVDDVPSATAARLGELFELSLLSGDLETALAIVRARAARAFRVEDCRMLRPGLEEDGELGRRSALAASLGTTLFAGNQSLLAAAIDVPGGGSLGTLALLTGGTRRFLAEERHTLRALARRLGIELAWRSAHERLATEHDRMRQSMLLDPLCGVLTRGAFEDAVAAEILRRAVPAGDVEPMALAVIDVMQLRQINDRHGHEAGDSALAQLADAVRSGLRPEDIVGRVGGDELAVLLTGASLRDARSLLEALARTIAETKFFHLETQLALRVRIGLTDVGADRGPGPPLARAFAAMSEARQRGATVHTVRPADAPPGSSDLYIAVESGDGLPPGTTLGGMYQVLHEISRGAMGVVYRAEDLGPATAGGAQGAAPRSRLEPRGGHPLPKRGGHAGGGAPREPGAGLQLRRPARGRLLRHGAGRGRIARRAAGARRRRRRGRAHRSGGAGGDADRRRARRAAPGRGGAPRREASQHRPRPLCATAPSSSTSVSPVAIPGAGDATGTPGFAAPESFMRSEEGPATDVYGLAATAYMMLTNLAPFGGGEVSKVLRRQLAETPAPPSLLRPGLPPAVDRIFAKALAPSLRERHASAVELGHDLVTTLAAAAADSTPPLGRTPSPSGRVNGPAARGVLFRIAYRILGNRLGSAWVRAAAERHPELLDVLSPTVEPRAWFDVERLVTLLAQVPPQVRDPLRVARELGRATMTASFARFYGADPSTLVAMTPQVVLADAPRFWPKLHSWGELSVSVDGTSAQLQLQGTPRQPLLCCLVEGSLERIAELAGGIGARARQSQCETQGDPACLFEVKWSASGPMPGEV